MGLLDDLKTKAEKQKAREKAHQENWQQLEKYYQDEIHPRMVELYNFLNQIVEHITYLDPETIAYFPVLPGSEAQPFRQAGYKLTIDSAKQIKNISLTLSCSLKSKLHFEIDGKEKVEAHSEILDSYKIKYDRRDRKDDYYELLGASYSVEGPINITVSFVGDIESSSITLYFKNFEKPGITKHLLKARHLNEEFMDSLGKYLLRENDKFLNLDISDEAKQTIREKIAEEKARQEQELIAAEEPAREEEENAKKKKTLKEIFSRNKTGQD